MLNIKGDSTYPVLYLFVLDTVKYVCSQSSVLRSACSIIPYYCYICLIDSSRAKCFRKIHTVIHLECLHVIDKTNKNIFNAFTLILILC